jgi:hypothetical protein
MADDLIIHETVRVVGLHPLEDREPESHPYQVDVESEYGRRTITVWISDSAMSILDRAPEDFIEEHVESIGNGFPNDGRKLENLAALEIVLNTDHIVR